MKTLKIAILGSGTVGVMSVCYFIKNIPNSEITCIHNPKNKILGIGESSTVTLPDLLWDSVKFNSFDERELSSTYKYGVLYKNWRKKNFHSYIIPPNYGLHFDNFKLSSVIFNKCKKIYKNRFKILKVNVENLNQTENEVIINNKIKYDYVIDCRGYPDNYDEYYLSSLPLNHCFVHMIPKPGEWNYTHHHATRNGWMFGIPLQHRQGWGYLFNDRITSEKTAIDDLSNIFKKKIKKENLREFKFKSYRSLKFLKNRIIKNGNKALFYEPMEALSGGFYDLINKSFYNYINKTVDEETVNLFLEESAKRYENFIYFIYKGGSNFKTPFWKNVKNLSKSHFKNNDIWKKTIDTLKQKNSSIETWPFFYNVWKKFNDNLKYKIL